MSITYPPEMLPRADEDAKVVVCSNSECCLKAENELFRYLLGEAAGQLGASEYRSDNLLSDRISSALAEPKA